MKTFLKTLLLSISGALALSASADSDPIYTGLFSNLALNGYDTVAYFFDGKPVKGLKEFSMEYKGAQWRFKNAENLQRFRTNPEAYAPQYGGYCAYAISQGDTASAEPDLWTIHEGKLYLNYSPAINKTWQADMESYIEKADANWPDILGAESAQD